MSSNKIIKLAIISEFNRKQTNYGNRFQAFALNRHINDEFPNIEVSYLYFDDFGLSMINGFDIKDWMGRVYRTLLRKTHKQPRPFSDFNLRLKKCEEFSVKHMSLPPSAYSFTDLEESEFDAFIVGSDVVWTQWPNRIRRNKFLDFEAKKEFKRIAYAASFGRDYIPEQNIKLLQKLLGRFDAISVREGSSVNLLKNIGIEAVHTLDPTLLLSADTYGELEGQPSEVVTGERFIFTYLLGTDAEMRDAITLWAKEHDFQIVTVPYAEGAHNEVDANFGDEKVMLCSPENWLWLIHNAEYIITDSFHGTAFATIFHRPFVVLERKWETNINNRMIDFLKTIQQSDKMLPYTELDSIDGLEWDYNSIDSLLREKIEFSKTYLRKGLIEND